MIEAAKRTRQPFLFFVVYDCFGETMTSKRRKIFGVFFKLLLAIGILELTSFVVLLYFAQERDPVRSETHVFDAHRNHRLNPEFPGHSEDGFRSETLISRNVPPNTIRIIALGTSALYGIGSNAPYPAQPALTNEETITAHLERSLNERLEAENSDFRVEVINAGVSAYRTYHHLVHLNSRLLDYKPDIVINVDGQNDFYKDQPDDPWNHYTYSTSVLVDQHNRRTFFLGCLTVTRSFSRFSNTFNLGERVFRRLWRRKLQDPLQSVLEQPEQLGGDFKTRVTTVAERQYVRDFWQIHQLGEYAGFQHAVFLQPQIVFESDKQLNENDQKLKRITIEHLPEGEVDKMKSIRNLLPDIFQKHEIPFFDVAQISPQNKSGKNLYLDYCHLTPTGAMLTAERISRHLFPMVVKEVKLRNADNIH